MIRCTTRYTHVRRDEDGLTLAKFVVRADADQYIRLMATVGVPLLAVYDVEEPVEYGWRA